MIGMMMAPEIKYTDRDVRENDTLRDLAEAYVSGYGGEFDPLVRAYNMLQMDGTLTTVMVRTVLNCMRNDESVASRLPEPKGYTMSTPPKKKEKQLPDMLWLRDGQFRIKLDYVVNLHPSAKYFHQIDHTKTVAIFYTVRYQPQNRWNYPWEPNCLRLNTLYSMCSKRLTLNFNNLEFVTLEQAVKVNEHCPRCLYGHRDAAWKP